MKMKLIVLALLAAAAMVAPSYAGTREEEAIRALRGVPPPELPARAAQVVANAPAPTRSAVATAVLEAVAQRTPSSAPAVRSALVNAGVLPPSVNVPTPVAPQAASAPQAVSDSGKRNGNGNGNSSGNGNGNGNSGNGNGNGNGTPPNNGGTVKTPNGNSRYPTAPPHGGNPPGHNGQPDRKGPPPFVDYTKPRSF